MITPRKIAYDLLVDWEKNATFPNLALKNTLRRVSDIRDRRFITSLVYGVIERKLTLDHYISKTSKRAQNELSVEVVTALRMGIYQMFYMEIPPSAACNTTVGLLKQNRLFGAAGFCNAILRNCAERRDELMLLKKTDYSVRYSIAPELVDLLLEQYGKEAFVSMMEGLFNRNEKIYLYRNPQKGSVDSFMELMIEEGIHISKTEITNLYVAESGFSVEDSLAYQNGWYHIVGRHSAEAAMLCPEGAVNIMDLCAAPGGKTFILASDPKRNVTAFDIHTHKVENMKRSIHRLGLHNVRMSLRNATEFVAQDVETADFVLCDVPCSGLGIMGKKPDIKYKKYQSADFVDVQSRILENGLRYLKCGGLLVYSTCTIDRRENSELILSALKDNPHFQLLEERVYMPSGGEDGFYIALIKKG